MQQTVNVALQLLPKSNTEDAYQIIDRAIACIAESGLRYLVCPFETVVEGPYTEVMELIGRVQETAFAHGAHELILNIKLQRGAAHSVSIDDKIGKYR